MLRSRPPASLAVRLAAPLAGVLALAAYARFSADPVSAAEAAYLGLALGVVLVAVAAVAPRPTLESVGGPLLAVAAVWTLPPGPARGAVAVAVAAGALAVAAVRWLPLGGARGAPGPSDAGSGRGELDGRSPAVPVLALAFGLQALLRGSELLAPGSALRGAALFVLFPLAGALALLALARFHGRRRALLAGAAALLVGPGFRPATLAALLALAAGSWLLARDPLAPDLLPPLLRAPVRGLSERGRSAARRAARGAAGAVLLAPFAWSPTAAAACLAAGLAAAAPTAQPGRRWLAAGPAAAALGLALLLPGLVARPLADAVPLASLVVLAVPALVLPGRDRAGLAVAALLLAFAAARSVGVEGALAPAAGLAALAVPRRGAVPGVQGTWAAILLGAAGLLAAYPWLRGAPLDDALALFGLEPGWPGALAAAAATGLLAGLAAVAARRAGPGKIEGAAARAVGIAALALAFLHLPAAGAAPVEPPGLVLDADRRAWAVDRAELEARRLLSAGSRVRALVLDSSLANAAALAAGTPVATLRLREPGRPDQVWTLRVGEETGEWAAGRPDLRRAGLAAPRPWTSWVAEGGGFFGRRYRSVHRLVEPAAPGRLELALRPDLPAGVALTVFHLELRP